MKKIILLVAFALLAGCQTMHPADSLNISDSAKAVVKSNLTKHSHMGALLGAYHCEHKKWPGSFRTLKRYVRKNANKNQFFNLEPNWDWWARKGIKYKPQVKVTLRSPEGNVDTGEYSITTIHEPPSNCQPDGSFNATAEVHIGI